MDDVKFLLLANCIGRILNSGAGICPAPDAGEQMKEEIRVLLEFTGITGAEFDARLQALAPERRLQKLERMGL